jgi:hypothetical protein
VYNRAGLKHKLRDLDFLYFIRSSEVFILFETFMKEINSVNQNIFQDFKLLNIPAVKIANTGRASGGSLCCINYKVSEKIKFQKLSNTNLIKIYLYGDSVYLLPICLNCNHWDMVFNELGILLNENQPVMPKAVYSE